MGDANPAVAELVETAGRFDTIWTDRPEGLAPEVEAAAGTLAGRQATLGRQLATAPSIWNAEIAPLVLQAMGAVHMTMSWILQDPIHRSRRFIAHGLAREQAYLNRRCMKLAEQGIALEYAENLLGIGFWIDAQHALFPEVAEAGPAGLPTLEEMANETNSRDFFDFFYAPFSPCTDSTWEHLGRHHLKTCGNPEHPFHVVPAAPQDPEEHFARLATSCLRGTLELIEGYLNEADAPRQGNSRA